MIKRGLLVNEKKKARVSHIVNSIKKDIGDNSEGDSLMRKSYQTEWQLHKRAF